MQIDEAIEQLERISKHLGSIGEKFDYTDMVIEALKFQQLHQEELTYQDGFDKGFNDGCEITEKEHKAKVQKCIERIKEYTFGADWNEYEEGQTNGINIALKIIKEEMGVGECR